MVRVIISDTHYGWKQNSITWLDSQMAFLDKQLIPRLKELRDSGKEVRLIHLGDVFDSRSSISPMVAKAVRDRYIKMASIVTDFYIVAGNHDFYSPNSDEIDSLSMVFRDCGIHLVINKIEQVDDDMFIPWYEYKRELTVGPNIKNIYTHADIFGEDRKMMVGVRLFSGHIHIPAVDDNRKWYSVGSCYPLNFADANHDRFYYEIDNDSVKAIPNKYSIRFWRIKNDAIFDKMHGPRDYYELYVDQRNMQNPRYQERCQELTKRYKNLCVIPVIAVNDNVDESFDSYDINEICEAVVPDHLKDKFKMVVNNSSKDQSDD